MRPTVVTATLRQAVSEEGMRRLAEHFGGETIDAAIRAAVRDGRPTFFAEEAGHQLGKRATLPDPQRCVQVGMVELAKGSR